MNRIGIIGAMDEEIALLRKVMQLDTESVTAGLKFYEGTISGMSVVLVKSGIGKVNAAVCAQILISTYHVDCVINVGVAGAVFPELKIGDLVISSDAVQHDMDCTVFGDALGIIPRMEVSFFPADRRLIEIAAKAGESLNCGNKVYIGRVASGDQFISSKEKKDMLWKEFQAYCTEMEGAAIAHVCYLNQVPFAIIRSISDSADGSADMDFTEFTAIAAKNSSSLVEKIIETI